jgi:hypothetical protein
MGVGTFVGVGVGMGVRVGVGVGMGVGPVLRPKQNFTFMAVVGQGQLPEWLTLDEETTLSWKLDLPEI